jgi:hypothetical protein
MPPKREPMVAIFQSSVWVSAVPTTKTTMALGKLKSPDRLGNRRANRGALQAHSTHTSTQIKAKAKAWGFMLEACCHKASTMPKKSAGMWVTSSPKKSLSWETMMSTAMPLVKAPTTATGMKRIKSPKRNRPKANRNKPDRKVLKSRPDRPTFCTTA